MYHILLLMYPYIIYRYIQHMSQKTTSDYWFSPFLFDEIPNQHPRCQPNPAFLMANAHRFLVILVFLFHQITAYYSHDAIPGKNGACDDLKPGRRLKDNDKTIHGNSWEWWKHELEPVSFLFGAISIEQAGELPSGSLSMSNCLTYLAWKSSFFCWKLVYKWRSL